MVLMVFRPQGLLPVRQKLLTYGRELYVAARRTIKAQDSELHDTSHHRTGRGSTGRGSTGPDSTAKEQA
jgi:branched-chain amino acid transport system permease protein